MRRINIINAFSLAETMMMLSVIGILLVLTAKSASKISLDQDLAKFKKAYIGIEQTVSSLINDQLFYGSANSGFKDLDAVTLENIGEVIGQNGVTKFRDAFKYNTKYVEDKIDCPIYKGTSSSKCFLTDYGVVFGIPDTDFVKKGVIEIEDANNNKIPATPITFYTNYKEGQNVDDNAFVVAITYDGRIYFQNTDGAKCNNKASKQIQCNIKKYIQATSVKRLNSD